MRRIINLIKKYVLYIIKYLFFLIGKDWKDFYSWFLNKIEKKNDFSIIKSQDRKYGFYSLETGNKDLKFLVKNGLKKHHKFLDYGCGYGRTAIPVIKFLAKNRYVGIDLSKERIRIAREYIKDQKLEEKQPILSVSYNKQLKHILGNQKFDCIFIYTVLVHNPFKEVQKILNEAKYYLKKDGKIFVDYWRPRPGEEFQSVKDYRLKKELIESFLLNNGFIFEDLDDFINYQPNKIASKYHRMLSLSLNYE